MSHVLPFAEANGGFESVSAGTLTVVVVVFLFINAFFVALEFALVATRQTKLDEMVREGVRGARSAQNAKRNVDDFVAACQLGITVASLVLGAAGEALFRIPLSALHIPYPIVLTLGSLGLMTILHVVVGEQVPKMLAIQYPARVAVTASPIADVFKRLCSWLIKFLSFMTRVILRFFGVRGNDSHHHSGQLYSEEEIQALLGLREAAGLAEHAEGEMISRVFSFFDMVATQVMVPRTEMVCVDSKKTLRELANLATEERHERFPVYGDNLDDIRGVVLLRDVVTTLNQQRGLDLPVTTVMREVLAVPGSLSVSALMKQMQKNRTRIAVVLDEFGGTAGMVTYGDLLERIVGEVEETKDVAEDDDIVPIDEHNFRVSGLTLIADMENHFNVDIEDDHNDTIGGHVFSQLGRKPQVGDEVTVAGLHLRVESMDGLRIDRLHVCRKKDEPASAEAAEDDA